MPKAELLDSFNRVNDLGNKFWHRFYDNFLASDERVRQLFEGIKLNMNVKLPREIQEKRKRMDVLLIPIGKPPELWIF